MAATKPNRLDDPAFEELGAPSAFLLALLGQSAMRRLRDALTEYGLKPRQLQILALLGDRGPMGQRELGEITGIDHSLLVTLLNPLEDEGLIERKRCCTDRRRHNVTITEPGRRRFEGASRAQQQAEDELFSSLTARQRDELASILRALIASVETPQADDCE
jgi:DNA-binding MarR family transcriptional regulator